MLITPTRCCKGSISSYKTIKEPADGYIKSLARCDSSAWCISGRLALVQSRCFSGMGDLSEQMHTLTHTHPHPIWFKKKKCLKTNLKSSNRIILQFKWALVWKTVFPFNGHELPRRWAGNSGHIHPPTWHFLAVLGKGTLDAKAIKAPDQMTPT